MEKAVTPYASPALKKLMPQEYHKWIPVIIGVVTKTVRAVECCLHRKCVCVRVSAACSSFFLLRRVIPKFPGLSKTS